MVDLLPYHTVDGDEGVYFTQATMLLEGKLLFYPDQLTEAVRPQLSAIQETPSVPGDAQLCSEYSPTVPALLVAGLAIGLPNLVLGTIAAIPAALIRTPAAGVFDWTIGVIVAGLLGFLSLFLLTSPTFLAYAPTTMLDLRFAVCYVRATRRDSSGYTVVAGVLVGAALFARLYTAVLFASPFIVHSPWALAIARHAGTGWVVFRRYAAIAFPGLALVGLTLTHNAVMTSDPFTFPHITFAPRDGIGFGEWTVLGYEVVYTPAIGVKTTTEAPDLLVMQQGPMGWLGAVAVMVGLGVTARHWWGHETGRNLRRSARHRHHGLDGRDHTFTELSDDAFVYVVVGVLASVSVDNAALWGAHNSPRNSLINLLGPFYHFDTLVSFAVFGAVGVVVDAHLLRRLAHRHFSASEVRGVVFSVLLVSALFTGGVTVGAVGDPYDENRFRMENLTAAYEPFLDVDFEQLPLTPFMPGIDASGFGDGNNGPGTGGGSAASGDETEALVSHPNLYGGWLARPFQALRNDPDFDGPMAYAIGDGTERDFAVLDVTNRTPYRSTYQRMWTGVVDPVEPGLTRLDVFAGERVDATTTLGVPEGTNTVSVRVKTDEGCTRYDVTVAESLTVEWLVSSAGVTATNRLSAAGSERLSIPAGANEVDPVVTYIGNFGETVTYRQTAMAERSGDEVRAAWPSETRVYRLTTGCGSKRGWVGPDGDYLDGVPVETDARVA